MLLLGTIAVPVRAAAPTTGVAPATVVAPAAVVSAITGPVTASAVARRVSAAPGNPGAAPLPPEAAPVDTSHPDVVVGTGTPTSCTSAAVVDAVAHGGVITFDCGPDPVTIVMTDTAKVVNTSAVVVLDGGGKVTLSGADQRRILYMNTCDQAQMWTTSHCQDQDQPQLTIQRMTFAHGNSTGDLTEGGGGGAVFVRGGRVKVLDSTFTANQCDPTGPDLGGGALRVLSQSQGLPVIVATSSFVGNTCSNGAAISSIGVSWQIYNSVFTGGSAVGSGANPARGGHARRRQRRRRSTSTATGSRSTSPAPSSTTTRPTRGAAPSSSSPTTAPASCASRRRCSSATSAGASRRPASPGSSSSAWAHPR